MNRFIYFLGYLLRSFHLHGIHSPFVYRLNRDVLKQKEKYYAYDEIESIRAKLLLTKKKVTVEDYGSGQKKEYQKSISAICRDSSQRAGFSQIIHRLAIDLKPETMLELGTSLGLTTAYLAKACPNSKVISIEGSEELSKIAEINLNKLNIHNVKLIQGTFEDQLIEALDELKTIDLLYFDGHHKKEATLSYFTKALNYANEGSCFIFDDIYWSGGMKEAWKEIKQNPRVQCSIDLFQIGIIFFDPKLTQKDFTVYHSANLDRN